MPFLVHYIATLVIAYIRLYCVRIVKVSITSVVLKVVVLYISTYQYIVFDNLCFGTFNRCILNDNSFKRIGSFKTDRIGILNIRWVIIPILRWKRNIYSIRRDSKPVYVFYDCKLYAVKVVIRCTRKINRQLYGFQNGLRYVTAISQRKS